MKNFLRDNGLSLALAAMFVFTVAGMMVSGWSVHNSELAEHGRSQLAFGTYLASGDFLSALFEN